MNPNGHNRCYAVKVEPEPVYASKEEKARTELAEGERREESLKRLHTEKGREVKQAQIEAQRLEVGRQAVGKTLRHVRLRNEQLRKFLAFAEEI